SFGEAPAAARHGGRQRGGRRHRRRGAPAVHLDAAAVREPVPRRAAEAPAADGRHRRVLDRRGKNPHAGAAAVFLRGFARHRARRPHGIRGAHGSGRGHRRHGRARPRRARALLRPAGGRHGTLIRVPDRPPPTDPPPPSSVIHNIRGRTGRLSVAPGTEKGDSASRPYSPVESSAVRYLSPMTSLDLLGFFAALLTTVSFVPQAIKTFVT